MWKGNYEALRPGAKNRELAAFLVRKGGKRKHIVQQMSVFFNFNVAARRDFYGYIQKYLQFITFPDSLQILAIRRAVPALPKC